MSVEVFSGPNCSYCQRAKEFLERKGVAYTDYDISQPEHRDELARRVPRARAIPQIFISGEHIGGSEDLELLDGDGRLDRLLELSSSPASNDN